MLSGVVSARHFDFQVERASGSRFYGAFFDSGATVVWSEMRHNCEDTLDRVYEVSTMMNALELLRFGWTPNQLKLLLVALADAGPVERKVWVARSGVPRNHLAAVLAECERLGGARVCPSVEGLAIHVQPVEFWRVTPLMERAEWAGAWRGVVQERLQLPTEMPGLAEALAVGGAPGFRAGFCPESGHAVKPLNDLNLLTFTVERSKGQPESGHGSGQGSREGWIEPETEAESQAACRQLFGDTEMRLFGGMWRNRWRANPEGVRKVLNLVREDQMAGRKPKKGGSWPKWAMWLWEHYVEVEK